MIAMSLKSKQKKSSLFSQHSQREKAREPKCIFKLFRTLPLLEYTSVLGCFILHEYFLFRAAFWIEVRY